MILPNKLAREADKVILIENCPHTYLPKGSDTYEVVKNINSNYIKLLWDPANSLITKYFQNNNRDNNIIEEYNKIKEYINYCHIKDYRSFENDFEFVPFGEGCINYKKLLSNFNRDLINIFLSLESELNFVGTKKSVKNYNNFLKNNKIKRPTI